MGASPPMRSKALMGIESTMGETSNSAVHPARASISLPASRSSAVLEALPLRPSGKVDRRGVARLLAAAATDVTSEPPTPGP